MRHHYCIRRASVLLLCLLCLHACSPAAPQPAPTVRRVLIISIDGMRADLPLRAVTPNFHELMRTGSFTFFARSTECAYTLPTHVSMLTGVTPARHQILWDYDTGYPEHPTVPTLFDLVRKAGRTSAMCAGKSKFRALVRDGSPNWVFTPGNYEIDLEVARHAVEMIDQHQPDLLFVHLPGVDGAGHGNQWGSPVQLKAIETADQAVGIVLAALRRRHLFETTTIIITADHGGLANTHGGDDPRSQTIPWLISGPGVRANYDLDRDWTQPLRIEDTFATACVLLGIPLPEDLDGKPVLRAFESPPASAAK